MGEICSDEMTADELSEVQNYLYSANDYVPWLQFGAVIACALIFFLCSRRLSKPTFILVMWSLFMVSQVAFLSQILSMNALNKAEEAGDTDKYHHFVSYFNESVNVYIATLMGGHWIFSIKYAEVVLKLPLLVFPETVGDIQARLKKISCVVWTLTGCFAALIFTYTVLVQLYVFGLLKGDSQVKWMNRLIIVITLAPIVLLLVAVIRVRCMVSKLRNKAILQKEKIILLHTVLFSLYFLLYVAELIAMNVEISTEDISTQCKANLTQFGTYVSVSFFSVCIFVLTTYMSFKFCQPLEGQWQQFLLGYREKSLNTYLRERYQSTDQEKARRFHEAAVQDANRQIMIISALMVRTQSTIEQDEEGTTDESLLILNTEERRILETTVRTSSSILLQKVRSEAARVSPSSFDQPEIDISRQKSINEVDAADSEDDN